MLEAEITRIVETVAGSLYSELEADVLEKAMDKDESEIDKLYTTGNTCIGDEDEYTRGCSKKESQSPT